MSRLVLLDCQRENDTLTLKLKHNFKNEPPIIAIIVALFCFGCLVQSLRIGINSVSDCVQCGLFLFFLTVSGLVIFHVYLCIHTLRYDSEKLYIENEYPRIAWKPSKTFDRDITMLPVSRMLAAPGEIDLNAWRWKKNFRYETWIPFGAVGGYGTICSHESEESMRELEDVFRKFWKDVPCRPKPTEEIVRDGLVKDFYIDRNEALPPERPFTVLDTIEENDDGKTLILVSEKGSQVSRFIAKCSMFLYRMIGWALNIGALSVFALTWYYWPILDPQMLAFLQGDRLHNEILPQYVPDWSMAPIQQFVAELIQAQPVGRMFVVFVIILFSLLPIAAIYSFLFIFLRWPFWKRWTIRLEHSAKRHHALEYDWQTDRYKEISPRTYFVPFFKVMSAASATNRFLTGRPFFSGNSGWRQPFQVVILTADRSLPLPVNDAEEQAKIVQILEAFVKEASEPQS